jgi:hypothetical protein
MSTMKRTLLILTLAVTSMGTGSILYARHQYYGVCSQLDGIPGILQRAGFFQTGTCAGKPGGAVCAAGSACTVNNSPGTCANTGKPGGAAICTCVATVTKQTE